MASTWNVKLQLKHLLNDKDCETSEQVLAIAASIASLLQARHTRIMSSRWIDQCYERDLLDEMEAHAEDFRDLTDQGTASATQAALNERMTALYDWTDLARVWIE